MSNPSNPVACHGQCCPYLIFSSYLQEIIFFLFGSEWNLLVLLYSTIESVKGQPREKDVPRYILYCIIYFPYSSIFSETNLQINIVKPSPFFFRGWKYPPSSDKLNISTLHYVVVYNHLCTNGWFT